MINKELIKHQYLQQSSNIIIGGHLEPSRLRSISCGKNFLRRSRSARPSRNKLSRINRFLYKIQGLYLRSIYADFFVIIRLNHNRLNAFSFACLGADGFRAHIAAIVWQNSILQIISICFFNTILPRISTHSTFLVIDPVLHSELHYRAEHFNNSVASNRNAYLTPFRRPPLRRWTGSMASLSSRRPECLIA